MAHLSALEILAGRMPAPQAAALRDSHAWPVVLDASAIIDDILYRTGPRPEVSALTIAMLFGVVRPLGKMDVIEEAKRRLPAIARSEDRDLAQMRRMLASDYVPGMRLVDPLDISIDNDRLRKLAREDPTDEPSARLNLLLDPSLLLTSDKDLLRNGFGVWTEGGNEVKWSYAAATTRDGAGLVTTSAAMVSAIMGTALVGLLVGDAVRTHPRVSMAVAGALVGALWAAAESPRWEGEWRPALAAKGKNAVASLGRYFETYGQAAKQLAAYKAEHPSPGTPVARIARTLALAPDGGLLVSEIRAIHPDIEDVSGTLTAYRAFVRVGRWRWTLGSPAEMPAP